MPRVKKEGPDSVESVDILKGASKKELQNIINGTTVDDIDIVHKVRLTPEMKVRLQEMAHEPSMVRHFVDQYEQAQQFRIRAQNQVRSLLQGYDTANADHSMFLTSNLLFAQQQEAVNKEYLSVITDAIPICQWMKSIVGIGPVFAAYLYSVLDINKAPYATNMLSYAGLNDNNNPWLGKEKAAAVVKEVTEKRKAIFDEMAPIHRKAVEDLGVSWIKYRNCMKGAVNACMEEKIQNLNSEYSELLVGKDNMQLCSILRREFVDNPLEYVRAMDHEMECIAGTPAGWHMNLFGGDGALDAAEYFVCFAVPKYVGPLMVRFVSDRTTRNIDSVYKGVCINVVLKSNKKEKRMEFDMPSTDDMVSYLAKPPYNTDLKKKCYQIGDSFIKQQKRGSLYGRIYSERYAMEFANNENLVYADQAHKLLEERDFSKNKEMTKLLESGKLAKSHIVARARRYAVKLFISHVYEAMYYDKYHELAPQPYIIAIGEHHDYIAPEVDFRDYL